MPDDSVHLDAPATVEVHVSGHGRVRVRFDAGDHPLDHDDPTVAAATSELARVLARRTDAVPATVDAVKDWVGDDPARAAAALEVEQARADGPRKSLEPWLAGLAAPDDATDAGDAGDDQEA